MRRALGLALLLTALAATPAGAAVPGPTVLDFEDQRVGARVGISGNPGEVYGGRGDVILTDSDTCGDVAQPGGNFGPKFIRSVCSPFEVYFSGGQAMASLYVRLTEIPGLARVAAQQQAGVSAIAYDGNGVVVDQQALAPASGVWTPVRLRSPAAAIRRVAVSEPEAGCCWDLDIDDIGFSPSPQPDADVTGGPEGTVASGDATFTFAGNQDRLEFFCKLDDAASAPCTSPTSYTGLADGTHTFQVIARDRWGETDRTPASRTFTVQRAVPPPDRDRDGIVDGSDNCPDNANTGQGDSDSDGVGDACEVLPSGNAPIEAGKAVKVKLLSGEVFVRLPAGASASAFTTDLRVPFQSSGFLPLKGVAAVPMGSTLDTRRGEVSITAAVNGQRPASPRQLRREARFRAGIFAIRQARKARKAKRSKRIPPRAELASPPGAETPCRASGPPKGVAVRSLSTTAKGVFRTVGGAATATPAKGTTTFITTDRCDGTVTEVGRGSVAVVAKRTGKRRVVRAGRGYIVRARLFAARKGRTGP